MADADTGGVEPVKIYENTFRLEPTEEQRSGDPRSAAGPYGADADSSALQATYRFKPSVAVNAMKETLEASMSYTLEKDEGGCAAITRRDGARTRRRRPGPWRHNGLQRETCRARADALVVV